MLLSLSLKRILFNRLEGLSEAGAVINFVLGLEKEPKIFETHIGRNFEYPTSEIYG